VHERMQLLLCDSDLQQNSGDSEVQRCWASAWWRGIYSQMKRLTSKYVHALCLHVYTAPEARSAQQLRSITEYGLSAAGRRQPLNLKPSLYTLFARSDSGRVV